MAKRSLGSLSQRRSKSSTALRGRKSTKSNSSGSISGRKKSAGTSKRGFGAMSVQKRKAIASKGGRSRKVA